MLVKWGLHFGGFMSSAHVISTVIFSRNVVKKIIVEINHLAAVNILTFHYILKKIESEKN